MKYQRKQTKQAETTNLPKTKDQQSSQSGNSKDIQALSESFGLIRIVIFFSEKLRKF